MLKDAKRSLYVTVQVFYFLFLGIPLVVADFGGGGGARGGIYAKRCLSIGCFSPFTLRIILKDENVNRGEGATTKHTSSNRTAT